MARSLSVLDGGTSHWRLYEFAASGNLTDQLEISPQPAIELTELGRGQLKVCAGMLTSATGLFETSYRATPAPIMCPRDLWMALDGWHFLPGVVDHENYAMMRGEDLLLMDAVEVYGDGWYVLPGTHSKWVNIKAGQIMAIRSFITGELRAQLLAGPSLSGLSSGHAEATFTPIGNLSLPISEFVFQLRYCWQHHGVSVAQIEVSLTQRLIADEFQRMNENIERLIVVSDRAWAQQYITLAKHYGVSATFHRLDPAANFKHMVNN